MLHRDFCVPDILGCFVASGLLPKKVMSWFNPRFWPRYKTPEDKTSGTMADNPEYRFFGGDSKSNKSIFRLRDDAEAPPPVFKEAEQPQAEKDKHDKCWPTDDDAYAWGHTGPGCLRIGFGFFPWETPNPFPNATSSLPILSAATVTSLWNINDIGANSVNNLIGTDDLIARRISNSALDACAPTTIKDRNCNPCKWHPCQSLHSVIRHRHSSAI